MSVSEIVTDGGRRRHWGTAEKLRIVEETLDGRENISVVARRNRVAPNLLYRWQQLMLEGGSIAVAGDDDVTSDLAHAPAAGDCPVSLVASTLGVGRSTVYDRLTGSIRARGSYTKAGDVDLLPRIRQIAAQRPAYSRRRIAAVINRQLRAEGLAPANHKRVYRIMAADCLLLARRYTERLGYGRDGVVVAIRSNLRWCSNSFEFTCWNGEVVSGAFIIDAHDREIIAWVAVANAGISGSHIRDIMLEAVEPRFGSMRATTPVEMLSDNPVLSL